MSTAVQRRRGTTAEHATFTGVEGEITVDTDKKVPVVHDGITAGGFPGVSPADLAAKAPLASPTFTGTPAAPTAAGGTNTTQLATTAFVQAAVAGLINAAPGALDTLDELAAAMGDDANFATTMTNALALKAPLASPALTGTPTAPTAAGGTNTTQIATTAFVTSGLSGKADTSHSHAQSDVTNLTSDLAAKAPLASPTFTGTPAAPTAAAGTNTTQLATTAFVKAAIDVVLGGVSSAFDTLSEIATAIAAKADAAATTAALAGKQAAATILTTLSGLSNAAGVLTNNGSGGLSWSSGSSGVPIPTSSVFAVGHTGTMNYPTTTDLANGATTAGSNVKSLKMQSTGTIIGGATQTGTWRNDSGNTMDSDTTATTVGQMTRTA